MKTYPLFKVHIDRDAALDSIKNVFDSGFINEGTEVTRLVAGLKQKLQCNNLILMNSCTSALTVALKLANVGTDSDDEVITTPMTCVATNTPIVSLGAKIVWADIDPQSGMIDPDEVKRLVSKRTKAVMAVAWAGTPPHMNELKKVCDQHNIPLVLDAAHAFDAHYRSEPIHKFADMTCYSFQGIKHFTCGDGGALVTNDSRNNDRARALKWFGLDRDRAKDEKGDWKGQQWDADIAEAGYKFNMNNVAAAIGLTQLPHIDTILHRHHNNAMCYDQQLNVIKDTVKPLVRPSIGSSFWVYTMLLATNINRDEILRLLNEKGIMAGLVHIPNDGYTAFTRFKRKLPGTREFAKRQFSLPCGWWLNEEDIQTISATLKDILTI